MSAEAGLHLSRPRSTAGITASTARCPSTRTSAIQRRRRGTAHPSGPSPVRARAGAADCTAAASSTATETTTILNAPGHTSGAVCPQIDARRRSSMRTSSCSMRKRVLPRAVPADRRHEGFAWAVGARLPQLLDGRIVVGSCVSSSAASASRRRSPIEVAQNGASPSTSPTLWTKRLARRAWRDGGERAHSVSFTAVQVLQDGRLPRHIRHHRRRAPPSYRHGPPVQP